MELKVINIPDDKEMKFLKDKGISQITHVPDIEKLDRNKDLEYYKDIVQLICQQVYLDGFL